jgi:hypothetical protein
LGLFICKSIVEDNEMRKATLTLNSDGAELAFVAREMLVELESENHFHR